MNPLNWLVIGNRLKKEAPDLVVVTILVAIYGTCTGNYFEKSRKNSKTKIIAITDNILPHEKRPGDKSFTKYFLKSCDAFITMSEAVMKDFRKFEKTKPAKTVIHPLYDNFGEIISKDRGPEIFKGKTEFDYWCRMKKSFCFLVLSENIKDWIFCSEQWLNRL